MGNTLVVKRDTTCEMYRWVEVGMDICIIIIVRAVTRDVGPEFAYGGGKIIIMRQLRHTLYHGSV
jgi:hypothetical protein